MTSVHFISGALIIGGIVWASRGTKKTTTEDAIPNEA